MRQIGAGKEEGDYGFTTTEERIINYVLEFVNNPLILILF